ncbi:DUF952 domain-containing protein [Lacisediminihabitans profunda]|uniref:DUF952 domain-containing protein n=1 Tax=Lacisediminihabitans profunda TaxID=2594790 RepID=A0A5C8UV10_9MICO|nr:DUF952 domain-containing protein [Lacisediminihabitans profunda]TXN32146.1 DUF952 domain-containing protein [Lacisediminihabitans profunda]
MTIFHIAHAADWAAALRDGAYRVSSRGATLESTGFIHASTAAQLGAVATRFYADDSEPLVVLEIDEAAASESGVEVRLEDGGGELFPHLYGPILPVFVTRVSAARFDADGRFTVEGAMV